MAALKKLTNPFLLGAEGFLVGAALFFATQPAPTAAAPSNAHAVAAAAAGPAHL